MASYCKLLTINLRISPDIDDHAIKYAPDSMILKSEISPKNFEILKKVKSRTGFFGFADPSDTAEIVEDQSQISINFIMLKFFQKCFQYSNYHLYRVHVLCSSVVYMLALSFPNFTTLILIMTTLLEYSTAK